MYTSYNVITVKSNTLLLPKILQNWAVYYIVNIYEQIACIGRSNGSIL